MSKRRHSRRCRLDAHVERARVCEDRYRQGQVIDQECYLMERRSTPTRAARCPAPGRQAGGAALTSDGKVYEITGGLAANKNAKLVDHMLHTVEITGDVVEKSGKLSISADTLKMVK